MNKFSTGGSHIIYKWLNERLEIQLLGNNITNKYVSPHINIFYCLGGITLTCFFMQVATGFAITFYARPMGGEYEGHRWGSG